MTKSIKRLDWTLIIPAAFLIGIGQIILFSINLKSQELLIDFNAWNQLLFVGMGLIAAILVARLDYRVLKDIAGWIYLLSIVSLVVVLFMNPTQGSSRWIDLGIFQFQPSEIVKLALIIMLSHLFSKRFEIINRPWSLILSLIYVGIPVALVFSQPDFGTAFVIGMIWLTMIAFTKIKKSYLILMLGLALALLPVSYQLLEPYQKERIATFISPDSDPQGAGYNVIQATIAIGSGGWLGNGLDAGSQSQLNFLPAQHTDFIFAVIGEKLGFLGASLVMIALLTIIIRAIIIAWRSQDRFGMYLALGIATVFAVHSLVNIGMNLSLLPVTGIPLPLLSYGGTHAIISLVMLGVLHNIGRQRP